MGCDVRGAEAPQLAPPPPPLLSHGRTPHWPSLRRSTPRQGDYPDTMPNPDCTLIHYSSTQQTLKERSGCGGVRVGVGVAVEVIQANVMM